MIGRRTGVCLVVWMGLLSAAAGPAAAAARGAGELSLDAAAVRVLIAEALPGAVDVPFPGGALRVELREPRRLGFLDGGIETEIPFAVPAFDWRGTLEVRYVPEVEPLSGTVRLRPETARASVHLPLGVDVAAWLDPVELPRRLDWAFPLAGETGREVTAFVQGIEVAGDRLRVELGLVAR